VNLAASAREIAAHNEGQLDLEPRLDEGSRRQPRTIAVERVIEYHAVVRLGHLRSLLHRPAGQPDLAPDDARTAGNPRLGPTALDIVGILERHVGPDLRRLRADLAGVLGVQDGISNGLSVSVAQHRRLT
jgi:hypothetical protein